MLFGRPSRPTFTTLRPAQAARCAALHREAFAHGWSELEFERLLVTDSSFSDAAVEGRNAVPLGFILSRVAADEAEVLTIVVDKGWRGRGIARQLLDHHLERLARARVRALFLEVNEDNAPARALYARAGFTEVGRRANYYPTAPGEKRADALVLRRAVG